MEEKFSAFRLAEIMHITTIAGLLFILLRHASGKLHKPTKVQLLSQVGHTTINQEFGTKHK
jgi:hypothetical protein